VGPSTKKKEISQMYGICENMLEISFPDGSGGRKMDMVEHLIENEF